MEKNSDKKLADIIGGNLQTIRTDLGVTLDQVARSLKRAGVQWSTGGVSNIEKARSTPNIQTLILLAYALTESNDKEAVTPLELLSAYDDDVVQLGDLRLRGASYNRLLNGDLAEIEVGDLVDGQERLDNLAKNFGEITEKYGPGVTLTDIQLAENSYSLSDSRAAKKLNMGRHEFIGASVRQWGHLLSVEAELRAGENASPQLKGRKTRELIAELVEQTQGSDHGGH